MRIRIGYTERLGRCVLKKVREYGYKYHVYVGESFYRFATIGKAREFALQDLQRMNANAAQL